MGIQKVGEKKGWSRTDGVGWAVEQVDACEEGHVVAVDDPRRVSVQR